jgi:hypothetical protein
MKRFFRTFTGLFADIIIFKIYNMKSIIYLSVSLMVLLNPSSPKDGWKELLNGHVYDYQREIVPNTLTQAEKEQGWRLLFDGVTTKGWRSAFGDSFPEKGWKVEDGAITVLSSRGAESANGGDIVTDEEFSAFELSLEFKITKGANSGIKYFVTDMKKHAGSAYGLEYQILDDENHPDAKLFTTFEGSRKCAGLYDLIAPANVHFNGVGQWNLAVIKVFPDNHVEHWLNGFKTVEYQRSSPQYRELIKGSKYAAKNYNAHGPFGEAKAGHILLQDHGNEVSFRSIKIRNL